MSALTLTSVTGIGGDKKLEEEKKKTEAERLKNGKIDQTGERNANPRIPVLTDNWMRSSYVKNSA